MRAGILTLQADSYGAVLQAYALQKTLEYLGAEGAFLAFRRSAGKTAVEERTDPNPLVRRIRKMGEQRHAHFASFRQRYLNCAPPCPWEEAERLNGIYDCFIVGSDQVWNPQIPGVDERYFLPFAAPEKRFSYAASFGTDRLPERLREWCGGQLARFRGLSVREESGRELVRELTGRNAAVHLDPVLLLDSAAWNALAGAKAGSPYMLLFLLEYDADLVSNARKSAAEAGLELRVCTASFIPPLGFEAWSGVSVERWLSLIRHAEGVFTNSFHGAAFSILFARPLCVARLTGDLSARNGRTEELLRLVGMEDALKGLCPAPSYELLIDQIEARRKASMDYLKTIIEAKA